MKVEQQAPVIRFTVELTAMELSEVKRELKALEKHEKEAISVGDDEQEQEIAEICITRFPNITTLVQEITEA